MVIALKVKKPCQDITKIPKPSKVSLVNKYTLKDILQKSTQKKNTIQQPTELSSSCLKKLDQQKVIHLIKCLIKQFEQRQSGHIILHSILKLG